LEDKHFFLLISLLTADKKIGDVLQQLADIFIKLTLHKTDKSKNYLQPLFKRVIIESAVLSDFQTEVLTTSVIKKIMTDFSGLIPGFKFSSVPYKEAMEAKQSIAFILEKLNISPSPDILSLIQNITSNEKNIDTEKKETPARAMDKKKVQQKEQEKNNADTSDKPLLQDEAVMTIKTVIQKEEKPEKLSKQNNSLLEELAEGIFVQNAGLVIVAGFLPMLFKKLKLLTAENIVTDSGRAVMLAQYLASGREEVAEFETGLAKVLCGIDLETPVDTSIKLSAKEKSETDELLQSAIEYWNVLKKTSPAALRESFLMRNGKLSFSDNEWLLQVEQKSFDMLLENLPWSISMIKLPWMKHLLKTEWFN
jgi:hypothetical protein